MRTSVWKLAVMIGIAFLFIMVVAGAVRPYEKLLPHFGKDHWYDAQCCNFRDCRPVSDLATGYNEVTEVQGGWLWKSSVSGKEHFFPHGSEKIKPSRDGEYHGCETPNVHLPLCLYIPMLF